MCPQGYQRSHSHADTVVCRAHATHSSTDNFGSQFSAFDGDGANANVVSKKKKKMRRKYKFSDEQTHDRPLKFVFTWRALVLVLPPLPQSPLPSIQFIPWWKVLGFRPICMLIAYTHTAHMDPPIQGAEETLIVMNKLFAHCLYVVLDSTFPFTCAHTSTSTRILFLTMSLWTFPMKIF